MHSTVHLDFPLIHATVTTVTHEHYRTAVHSFLQWVLAQFPSLDVLSSSSEFDITLTRYLHFLWRSGKGKQAGKNAFHGCLHYLPMMKGKLYYASSSLRGWDRLAPSVPHLPMSYSALVLVAVSMASQGWLSSAIGVLLGFDCYLRVSELTALRKSDVALPNDRRLGLASGFDQVALRIRKAKRGVNQWVTVRSACVRSLLLPLVASAVGPEERIFNFSSTTFRKRLHVVCSGLGLPHYVPHSLRHGGATLDHLSGISIDDIMVRGRWASVRSARHYVQQGRALLLEWDMPSDLAELADALRPALLDAVQLAASSHSVAAARKKHRRLRR